MRRLTPTLRWIALAAIVLGLCVGINLLLPKASTQSPDPRLENAASLVANQTSRASDGITNRQPDRATSPPGRRPSDPLLASAQLLAAQETAPDARGRFVRTRLVRSDFKYPVLRVEETLTRDAATGDELLMRRVEMVGDHILVKLRPGAAEPDLVALSEKLGGHIRGKRFSPRTYLVAFVDAGLDTVPDAVAAFARELGLLEFAEADHLVHALATPNDPSFGQLWGLFNTGQNIQGTPGNAGADIEATNAWNYTVGSSNVIIGMLDSGVDYLHPDLTANLWVNPANGSHGTNLVSDNNDPWDDDGHGTHVAGIADAVGDNGVGVAGVAWRSRLMAVKFLNANGIGTTSDAIDALHYAIQHGARLTSNAWGGDPFSVAVQSAIADSAASNMLFIAAAGNAALGDFGQDNDAFPYYPGSYTNNNIIAVMATDSSDGVPFFSNYGHNSVDLAAPGENVLSTIPNGGYDFESGTSMATAHVAGVAALAWALKPDATWQQIKSAILSGTDPVPVLAGNCVSGGRLNAFGALRKLRLLVLGSVPSRSQNIVGQPADFTITFADACDTNSVSSADFTLDGVPASSVGVISQSVFAFHFNATPATNYGPHVMVIAENTVARLSDGSGVAAWTATFTNTQPWEDWRLANFLPAELANLNFSGEAADPEGDRIPNLLEYALGTKPKSPENWLALTQPRVEGGYFKITFARVKAATDAVITAEVSGNLVSWNSGPAYLETTVVDNGSTEVVTVRDLTPASAGGRRFIRLKAQKL